MPIQPAGAQGVIGKIKMLPQYVPGLQDLEGFSHIILIYHFHRSDGYDLELLPFLDESTRGVFATRAPRRPNPIGLSTVKLESISGATLHISGVDILDGTPLLDIKPFVPDFDQRMKTRIGWLTGKVGQAAQRKADNRFHAPERRNK